MSEFPKGWASTELANLFEFVLGGDWGKDTTFNDDDYVEVYCIRGTEFKLWNKEKGSSSVPRKIRKSSLEKRTLEIGDILIEISGGGPVQPVGRTVLIDERAIDVNKDYPKVCTNFIRLARPFPSVSSSYLNYYLRSFYLSGEVTKYQGGSNNLRNLKFKEYNQIRVPLAPLNEQKRIADKLDSILAKVDRAQARLEKIPGILKRFRQSVLAAATSGELTREWRKQAGVGLELWNTMRLEDICHSISDGDHQAPPKAETGIPFLVISNVSKGCIELESVSRWVPQHYFDALKDIRKPKIGDILYTVTGSYGIPVKVETDVEFCFQRHIAILKPKHDVVNKDYLFHFLGSNKALEQAKQLSTGTAQKTLSLSGLRGFSVCIPSIYEQNEIVGRITALFSLADVVEKNWEEAKLRLDRLTQSILAKAFRGELVAQDQNDEPASELLKRINSSDVESKPKRKATSKPKASTTPKSKRPKQAITELSELLDESFSSDLAAEKHEVIDSLRVSHQTEIKKAQELLVNAKFSVEQFRSITDFKGGYDELKALIMNLLKGIPSVSEPLLSIESWDEKSGDYLMRLVK